MCLRTSNEPRIAVRTIYALKAMGVKNKTKIFSPFMDFSWTIGKEESADLLKNMRTIKKGQFLKLRTEHIYEVGLHAFSGKNAMKFFGADKDFINICLVKIPKGTMFVYCEYSGQLVAEKMTIQRVVCKVAKKDRSLASLLACPEYKNLPSNLPLNAKAVWRDS